MSSIEIPQTAKKPAQYRIYSQEQAFRHLTQPRPEAQQKLYTIIDEVLFNVWDALCLSVDDEYREEYLPYLPHVFDLLLATDDGDDLYDYLIFIEKTKLNAIDSDNLAKFRAKRTVDILLEYRKELLAR